MITPAYSLTSTERVLPKLALDFTTGSLDPRITVTRALNTATCVNSNGFIETINADLPRFDYDPVTKLPKGLLIEESRANRFTYSSDFSNVIWAKTNVTVGVTPDVSPSGSLDAFLISGTTPGSFLELYQNQTVTASAVYTYSAFVNADVSSSGTLRARDTATVSNRADAEFNLVNKTVNAVAFGTYTNASGTIVDYGSGWYRVIITFTVGSSTSIKCGLYQSGVASGGIYLWGAQLEAGAFATSYIPTTTTSVTRNADVVSMTGTNFSDWYNQAEGTLVTQMISVQGYPNIGATVVQDGTNYYNNRNGGVAGSVRTLARTAGAFNVNTSSSVATANVVLKQGIAYSAGAVSAARQGSIYINNVAQTLATGMVQMDIGGDNTNFYWSNGHVQKIQYWPMKLTNAELAAFTK